MRTIDAQERPILPSATQKRTKTRIVILMLLSIGTMINYLDRTILGVVAPKLTREIDIDPAMMGIVFSAFAWTYALAQIPGGMFLDRFGNKLTYALSIFFWSTFTLLQSFSVGLKSLLLLRLGLGISEAPVSRLIAVSSVNGFRSMNAPGQRRLTPSVNILAWPHSLRSFF